MKIDNSTLRFTAASSSRDLEERQQAARIQQTSAPQGRMVEVSSIYARQENVRLQSSQSAYLYSRSQISSVNQPGAIQVTSRESLLQSMVSHAFSREVQVSTLASLRSGPAGGQRANQGANITTQASVAFGQAYRYQSEQQSTLTIEGRLNLADQRNIDFVLHTRLDSRLLFESGSGEFARFAVRTDPLILNLQGGVAQLTDTAFHFDLDGDGTTESVSLATGGSGFIAFDRNGDGKINDGRELFGTRSGDGFAELAQYDDDGNGFIDAADAIYSQLKFWRRDEDGTDHLSSLQDAGVSAIGLQSADTPLRIRGQAAQELGTVRSTGIFVSDTGSVGTVQQVDLARRDTAAEKAFAADFTRPQFIPDDASTPQQTTEQQQLEDIMRRLNSIHDAYMAGLDERGKTDSEESKTLLQQLVDMLEQQMQELADKRDHGANNHDANNPHDNTRTQITPGAQTP